MKKDGNYSKLVYFLNKIMRPNHIFLLLIRIKNLEKG
jgi:hypothetical protein